MPKTGSNVANEVQNDAETIPVGEDWELVVDHIKTLAKLPLSSETRSALNQMIPAFQGPHTHGGRGTKRIPRRIPPPQSTR